MSFRSLLGFGLCPSPDLLLPGPESIIRLLVMTEESLLEQQTRDCGRSATSHEKPVPGKGNAHISDFMCNLISRLVTHTFKTNVSLLKLVCGGDENSPQNPNSEVCPLMKHLCQTRFNTEELLSENNNPKNNSIHLIGFVSLDGSMQISMQNTLK